MPCAAKLVVNDFWYGDIIAIVSVYRQNGVLTVRTRNFAHEQSSLKAMSTDILPGNMIFNSWKSRYTYTYVRQWDSKLVPLMVCRQCWVIVIGLLSNKREWNFNQNNKIFIEENTFTKSPTAWRPFCPCINVLISSPGYNELKFNVHIFRFVCQSAVHEYPTKASTLADHYSDVIMGTMGSQITSLTIVYSIVYSGSDQWKHQSSASLAFVRGIHRWPVNSPHKGPVTRKMFPCDDVIIDCFRIRRLGIHVQVVLLFALP